MTFIVGTASIINHLTGKVIWDGKTATRALLAVNHPKTPEEYLLTARQWQDQVQYLVERGILEVRGKKEGEVVVELNIVVREQGRAALIQAPFLAESGKVVLVPAASTPPPSGPDRYKYIAFGSCTRYIIPRYARDSLTSFEDQRLKQLMSTLGGTKTNDELRLAALKFVALASDVDNRVFGLGKGRSIGPPFSSTVLDLQTGQWSDHPEPPCVKGFK